MRYILQVCDGFGFVKVDLNSFPPSSDDLIDRIPFLLFDLAVRTIGMVMNIAWVKRSQTVIVLSMIALAVSKSGLVPLRAAKALQLLYSSIPLEFFSIRVKLHQDFRKGNTDTAKKGQDPSFVARRRPTMLKYSRR